MAKCTNQDIWRHNGRKGTVKMFQGQLADILSSPVPTERSKELARQLQPLVEELYSSLGQRSDQKILESEVSSAENQ